METNIAATLLKVQEKKTQKGKSYAIVKLTDLSSVFELFIFSELLEKNRDLLVEGNSLLITLVKNSVDQDNRFKRINVKKIIDLRKIFNLPISEITFKVDHFGKIKDLNNDIKKEGNTEVKIEVESNKKLFLFKLKKKRHIDRETCNLIKKKGIFANIS